MTNYVKSTDFAAKDSLITGNPAKLVKGTEINTEFVNIQTAVSSKLDSASVSAFAATILDDTTASAVRTTIGSSVVGDAVFVAVDAAAARTALGAAASGPLASSGITGAAASGANNDITSLTALASVPTIVSSNVVNLTGNQTVAGIKTFSSQPVMPLQSMVRLTTTGIANGTTNTVIARFSTTEVSQGSDITYADSVTLGALFTTNANGVYAISFTGGANCKFGISLNATGSPITTGIATISAATRLSETIASAAGYYSTTAWTGYLPSGSLIRAHTDATAMGANASFTITRIA